jgi:uncharacterized protein (TIGR00159 family)
MEILMLEFISGVVSSLSIFDLVDVVIITLIIFKGLQMIRGSRTYQMIASVVLILLLLTVSKTIGMRATSWLLSNFTGYLVIVVVIIFQPELRRALMSLTESGFFRVDKKVTNKMLEEMVRAVTILANRQIGALIVIQRKEDLMSLVTVGQLLDSELSRDLLISIFIPYSPLHDGAVLVNGSRISFAGCILPLTKREDLPQHFGTRHRAAIGISEETDAVVVVVSEERGSISVVSGGLISTELDAEALMSTLENLLTDKKEKK